MIFSCRIFLEGAGSKKISIAYYLCFSFDYRALSRSIVYATTRPLSHSSQEILFSYHITTTWSLFSLSVDIITDGVGLFDHH